MNSTSLEPSEFVNFQMSVGVLFSLGRSCLSQLITLIGELGIVDILIKSVVSFRALCKWDKVPFHVFRLFAS